MKISAAEFAENVVRYQDAALGDPVRISGDGKPDTVLVSAHLFELLTTGRVARVVEDLDPATRDAIAASAVPSNFSDLDELLIDWKP